MRHKIMKFGAVFMALCLMFSCVVYADDPSDEGGAEPTETELSAPSDDIASLDDGLLIEGGQVEDEAEYLEAWEDQQAPKTHNSNTSTYSMLDSITDSNGQYNGYDVYTVEDAAKYCIDLMKEHTTTASKKFLVAAEYSVSELGSGSPYNYAFNAYTDAFADAFNDSLFVDGKGGDYLLYSMYGRPFQVTSSCKYFTSGDTGIALVYATPTTATYYTSASQEASFTSKAASAVSTIKSKAGSSASDYDKVCAVYDYIVDNVEYDYDNLSTSNYYVMYTAYGALCDGKAVCQGYANLFYYLCNELGVPCRIVAGTGYTGSASGPHAWNIVKMGDKWYHVDVTWGDSYSSWYSGRYFFLQSEANFQNGHNGTKHIMDYMTGIQYIDYTSSEFLSAYPISQTDDYCNHSYSLVSSKAASCGVYGYTVYKCSKCNETYEDTINALSHKWTTTKEPTCTETGTRTCSNCGTTETVAATGHDYEATQTVEAGCVTDGYTVYTCKNCGHTHTEDIVQSKGGHSYEFVEHVDMTHTSDGYDEYKCSACGETYQDVYPAVANHVFEKSAETSNYTETCGYDEVAECTICGHTEAVLSDLHKFEDYGTYTADDGTVYDNCEVCVYCGTIINAGEEDANGNAQIVGQTTTATVCDEHTEESISAVTASCLSQGHDAFTRCSVCGQILDGEPNFTEPTGHTEAAYEKAATCTENGHKECTYCSVCHEVLEYGAIIEAQGHVLTTVKGYDATCTEDGLTDHVYCTVCGEDEESAEVIPALGHDEVITEAKDATCTQEGNTEGIVCARCGEVFEELHVLPPNGHAWETVEKAVEKTCTEDGKKALIVCAVCGEVDPDADGSTIAAGHDLTHMLYQAATEYEDGNIEFWYCHGCDECFLDEAATQLVPFEDTVIPWTSGDNGSDGGSKDGSGSGTSSGNSGTDSTDDGDEDEDNDDSDESSYDDEGYLDDSDSDSYDDESGDTDGSDESNGSGEESDSVQTGDNDVMAIAIMLAAVCLYAALRTRRVVD